MSFGDPGTSTLATVGLNPSNLEFLDQNNIELDGYSRRFHTKKSLQIQNWGEINSQELSAIISKCISYFKNNPYDAWFKKLDYLISGSKYSYYFPTSNSCHLDLVPYATSTKWGLLTNSQRSKLLQISINSLGKILNTSSIETLVLNGRGVVDAFNSRSQGILYETLMPGWHLPRKNGNDVLGIAYQGFTDKVGDIKLDKSIRILGFNHNIQSSFGVTSKVQQEIRNWITKSIQYEKI
ncbi:hypothetical protein [Marinoscillum sp. 108]|uniref:hypothetical protein n=1 Tax=Marinoscillum sp. 108 TaxID=2653151 RepID=UPI001C86A659|nr:hypothetical protein [Marinoscillum sp. 108]